MKFSCVAISVILLLCALPMFAEDVPLLDWTVPEVSTELSGIGKRSTLVPNAAVPSAPSRFITMQPCRVVDTRSAVGPYGGPIMTAGSVRTFAIPAGVCGGIPATAAAYSLNFSVTQTAASGFLTSWPAGATQPVVATMTWFGASQTLSSAAIVPAGTSGSISVYVAATTHVIIDINGYFLEQATSVQGVPRDQRFAVMWITSAGVPQTAAIRGSGSIRFSTDSGLVVTKAGTGQYCLNVTSAQEGAVGVLQNDQFGPAAAGSITVTMGLGPNVCEAVVGTDLVVEAWGLAGQ